MRLSAHALVTSAVWAAALAYLVWVAWPLFSYEAEPLRASVDLSHGARQAFDFKTDLSDDYVIELEASVGGSGRGADYKGLLCLLGIEPGSGGCAFAPAVDVSWTVLRGSQHIAAGESKGRGGGRHGTDSFARRIGAFEAERGARYTLHIESSADGSALLFQHPRIVVVPARVHDSGRRFWTPFVLGFHALAAAAVAFLLLAGLSALAGKRSASSAQGIARTKTDQTAVARAPAGRDTGAASQPTAQYVLGLGMVGLIALALLNAAVSVVLVALATPGDGGRSGAFDLFIAGFVVANLSMILAGFALALKGKWGVAYAVMLLPVPTFVGSILLIGVALS
jgi:hypothetical protein